MLMHLVEQQKPEILTTYTRNPHVIRMLARVCDTIYPLVGDENLRDLALKMEHASLADVAYHIDRYGEDGLFRGEDPADRPLIVGDAPLKKRFTGLVSVRNALVVAARVRGNS